MMDIIGDMAAAVLKTGVPIIATISIMYVLKIYLDRLKKRIEDKEIEVDVTRYVGIIDKGTGVEKDVLALMVKNVAELREYYVINKQQARNSFSAALFISVLGFILFSSGVVLNYVRPGNNVIAYSTIGGAIVEIIAGLFFWLYSKAISQINLFHTSLLKTEKFLTAIQLVEKVSSENRDRLFSFIISKIISPDADKLPIDIPKTEQTNPPSPS